MTAKFRVGTWIGSWSTMTSVEKKGKGNAYPEVGLDTCKRATNLQSKQGLSRAENHKAQAWGEWQNP